MAHRRNTISYKETALGLSGDPEVPREPLEPIRVLYLGVKGLRPETDCYSPSRTEVKNAWSHVSILIYIEWNSA